MNFYEFGVTKTVDWSDVKTAYVKTASSRDAIRLMLKLTCPTNILRPFIDFKFRTAIPECCIENNAVIFSGQEFPFTFAMIKKVHAFTAFSDQEGVLYKFTRDSFSSLPGPAPFTLRKVTRTGEVVHEVRNVEESTAGFILDQLLLNHQDVEIEYFSYTREFQERNK